MSKKRVLVISDMHCGHVAGLTPPAFQRKYRKKSTTKWNKFAELSRGLWGAYVKLLRDNGPYDYGFDLGDMIEGRGERSGGTELLTSDRQEQMDIALECHNQVRLNANRGFQWIGVYGTAYHVSGDGEDWENEAKFKDEFLRLGSHEWVTINECTFDLKHHIGNTATPVGMPPLRREYVWGLLWAERGETPHANVILRGHVHLACDCGGPGWRAMTVPALQGMGSKFGARRCSGTVDWGITVFDVDSDGSFDWKCLTVKIESQKAKALKLA